MKEKFLWSKRPFETVGSRIQWKVKIKRVGFALSFEVSFAGLSEYVFQWICAESLGEMIIPVAVRYLGR